MTLLIDTFWTEMDARLGATGWVITDASRYDPTTLSGLTPTGRVFSASLVEGTVTITVAGRVRTVTRAKAVLEPGDATVDVLLQAWQLLPLNQR